MLVVPPSVAVPAFGNWRPKPQRVVGFYVARAGGVIGELGVFEGHGHVVLWPPLGARVGRWGQAVELLGLPPQLEPAPMQVSTKAVVVGFPATPRLLTDRKVSAFHLCQRLHTVPRDKVNRSNSE